MTIDILIAVAQKGGVENVINMTSSYLQKNGWKVRVVQLVWEGVALYVLCGKKSSLYV